MNEHQRADHYRDHLKHDAPTAAERILADMPRRRSLSNLIGYCEGVVGSGLLGEEMTANLQRRIDEVLSTHGLPLKGAAHKHAQAAE